MAHFGVDTAVAPAALLFRRIFFSLVLGVVGLFSPPLLNFRGGISTVVVSILEGSILDEGSTSACVGVFESSFGGAGRGASRAFLNIKAPGSPTNGLSSMYSLP